MILAVSFVSIAFFVVAFSLVRVVPVAAGALSTARGAIHAIHDSALDDNAREKAVQRASVRLLGAFASILLRSIAALVAAFVPIYLADSIGLATSEEVMVFLARWDVILGATIVVGVIYYAKVRLWPRQ